tara:strand:- start:656 stop:859 length:204 start_codon:yes stop_codon:yes gene_type:complete
MTLSDDVIAQLVKLLQLAILTGTDISDNLRTLRLVNDGDKLELDPDYLANFEENLARMQNEAGAISE